MTTIKIGDRVQYGPKGHQATYRVTKIKPGNFGPQSLTLKDDKGVTVDNVEPGLDPQFAGVVKP